MHRYTSRIRRFTYQVLSIRSTQTEQIVERTAKINFNHNESVFYNVAQCYNRDLSVLVVNYFAKLREDEKVSQYKTRLRKYEKIKGSDKAEIPRLPQPGITILEPLAASGIRSIRYFQEVLNVRRIDVNDLDAKAVETAKANFAFNGIATETSVNPYVRFTNMDAVQLMNSCGNRESQYDVIDIDPYGTSAPFLDAAVHALSPGGLLCVTSTDMRALGGKFPSTCYSQYGSMPLSQVDYIHEMSLRILLHAVETAAAKQKKYIVPWLSISTDFYVRVFVRVMYGPSEVRKSAGKRIMAYQSEAISSFYLQRLGTACDEADKRVIRSDKSSTLDITQDEEETADRKIRKSENHHTVSSRASVNVIPTRCEVSDSPLKIGGPFWGEKLHDTEVVQNLLSLLRNAESGAGEDSIAIGREGVVLPLCPTHAKLIGLLQVVASELPYPFFYTCPTLFANFGIAMPSKHLLESALVSVGYAVSAFHRDPQAIKTNAPNDVVWDAVRGIVKIQKQNMQRNSDVSDASPSNPVPTPGKFADKYAVSKYILSQPCKTKFRFFENYTPGFKDRDKLSFAHLRNPDSWGPKRRAYSKQDHDEDAT